MEQNRKSRNRPKQIIANSSFLTKEQRQYNGEKIDISTDGAGTNGHPLAKKINLHSDLTCFTKKLAQNGPKTSMQNVKLYNSQKVTGDNLNDLGFGSDFLNINEKE